MQATIEQILPITVFGGVEPEALAILQLYTLVQFSSQGEMIMHEGGLPARRLNSNYKNSINR